MPKKQSAKKSIAPQHRANIAEHDMGAFQDLPPLTNIGSFPLPTAPTQNIMFRPPLLRHDASFTLQDESDNSESDPEHEPETQHPPQTQTQTQSQTQPQSQSQASLRIQTSEIGSSSTLDDPRTTIIPCGDG